MQFKTKAADEAYREIIQTTGREVADLEDVASRTSDQSERMAVRMMAKQLSIFGLCRAIETAHTVDMQTTGLIAGVAHMTNGK